MTDMRKLEDRYRNDPVFHAMVKVIYHQLETVHLTPSEVRDAAMLASIRFELLHAPVLANLPDIPKKNPWY